MKRLLLAGALLLSLVAGAANLTIVMPDGCTPVLNATTITCGSGTVTPPPVVVDPPPVTASCAGFAQTIALTMNWNAPSTLFSGGMGPNDVLVVQFTTGPNANPNQYGNIVAAEYQSDPSARDFALSTARCDFGKTLGAGAASTSNTATATFSVGTNASGYYAALQPNTTYFLNVRNTAGSTCRSSGVCNMYVQLHKPPGT